MSAGLCLAGAGFLLALGTSDVTLSWTHSVEKTQWRETWRRENDALRLVEVAIKGSGAGMEPDPSAVLRNGFYAWQPSERREPRLVLRRSGATEDWSLCREGRCDSLGSLVRADLDPVRLEPCP
jgi:hypothetical protein